MGKYERVLAALRCSGARVEQVEHPYASGMRDIMRCEFRRDLENYLAASPAQRKTLEEIIAFYEADPARCMPYGITLLRGALDGSTGHCDDAAYLAAMEERRRCRARMLESLHPFDACHMTGPTNAMHFAGLPSVAIRLGMGADGLPRGMILYGAEESRLFADALTLERYVKAVLPPQL